MNHRPRKRFSQNFLHDGGVIEQIIASIHPHPGEHIVEIGPGQGALTALLLETSSELDVVELDRDLAAALRKGPLAESGRLHIHEADALRFDFAGLAKEGERLRIVGNLPYNISTPLLFHLLAQMEAIRDIHVMLQKEVVDRLASGPGVKSYGRLSVMVQYHCEVERLFTVVPGAFRPVPRVDSAVVRLTPHRRPPVQVGDEPQFRETVKQAFMQRRKTLRNALKGMLTEEAIVGAGVDPSCRAETLDLSQFAALSNAVDPSEDRVSG